MNSTFCTAEQFRNIGPNTMGQVVERLLDLTQEGGAPTFYVAEIDMRALYDAHYAARVEYAVEGFYLISPAGAHGMC